MSMTLIQTVSVTSNTASIVLSSIPQDADDLVIYVSSRANWPEATMFLAFNGLTTNFSNRWLRATGSGATSGTADQRIAGVINPSDSTASTFASTQIYIPNYRASQNKTWSSDSVYENNGSIAWQMIIAGQWANTAAISSVALTVNGNWSFVPGSTVSLYKITKA